MILDRSLKNNGDLPVIRENYFMEISLIFDIVSTSAVIIGIVFGLIQLRQYQLSRKREASIFLLNSFQTKDFVDGIWIIMGLPNGLSKKQIDQTLGDEVRLVGLVMSTWESVGILLFNHEIDIKMVDDAFSGPIIFSWQKLQLYVSDLRKELERETILEWFQWLSDRMQEYQEKKLPVPAHIAHADWD